MTLKTLKRNITLMGKNKYTEINYQNLEAGDIVCCGGKSPLAYIIRIVTKGWKKRHEKDVSTHTGIVIEFGGQKFIAEMLGTGKGLEINSLETYCENNRRFIIDVYRSQEVDANVQEKLLAWVAYYYRRSLQYDYVGLFEFLSNRFKDDEGKFYCSEFVAFMYHTLGLIPDSKWEGKVSPEDIQEFSEENYEKVDWRI
jgi:cell wall-associated NlpC family hydrolase